jgi:hypothetical protein
MLLPDSVWWSRPGGAPKFLAGHDYFQVAVWTVELPATACLLTRREAKALRWHQCLGHLNFQAMKKMAKEELTWGLLDTAAMEHPCGACLEGKQKR